MNALTLAEPVNITLNSARDRIASSGCLFVRGSRKGSSAIAGHGAYHYLHMAGRVCRAKPSAEGNPYPKEGRLNTILRGGVQGAAQRHRPGGRRAGEQMEKSVASLELSSSSRCDHVTTRHGPARKQYVLSHATKGSHKGSCTAVWRLACVLAGLFT